MAPSGRLVSAWFSPVQEERDSGLTCVLNSTGRTVNITQEKTKQKKTCPLTGSRGVHGQRLNTKTLFDYAMNDIFHDTIPLRQLSGCLRDDPAI